MTDYKDTLNLPNTSFPMKASLAQREPKMLEHWIFNRTYEAIRNARKGCKRFVLHDGPPYANGHLHCGHALNKILKDIIIKSKTMSGFDAPFIPGWDCHGLPVELNVEKKLGKVGVKVNPTDYRKACREYAESQIDIQRTEFQRLGVFGDWQKPYATMNYVYEANIVRALGKIIENGHLVKGYKPVHWCIDCGSSLAEAEVDYEDKRSISIDVAFYAQTPDEVLKKIGKHLPSKPVIVPIWTTTPWTLPANEAVSLHPRLSYSLVDAKDCYFIVATDLVNSVMARYQRAQFKVCHDAPGEVFEHIVLKHPFYKRVVPIVLGDHVTTESGTGAVHTAPAHGPDDYLVGQRYHLPLINPVLANGCYASDVPLLAGLSVLKVEEKVLALLREHHTLLHTEMISHSYPHCWRHKSPVIFRATPQWFISMDQNGLRKALMKAIEQVNWVPDWGKARIVSMVETRPDWCVSRQRAWGTPMPLFIHKKTGELHPKTQELIERVALKIEQFGIDAWFDLSAEELLGEDAKNYDKSADTLDVWFDSGVSHFCVLKQNEALGVPADVYFEGSDQHRGWFNSSMTTAVAIYKNPPYRSVLTHGYTVDAEGKKLSKSKGNYVELSQLIHAHGADILRLWVASTDYRNEVSISDEIIKRNADAYRRIRNTARFLLSNLFDFSPQEHMVEPSKLIMLDRWAILRAQALQAEILKAYDQYQFHLIYQKIHNFCAVDMGSFYLDIIKDRQYTTPTNSVARRSCQSAMFHIVHALTRWLAPILSFTADEIWHAIPGHPEHSVFEALWYDAWPKVSGVSMKDWDTIHAIRDEVNKALEVARQAGTIGSGLAANVVLYVSRDIESLLEKLKLELQFILITSGAKVRPLSEKPSDILVNEELGIAISVLVSDSPKCVRCWHRSDTVGESKDHPELCNRCIGNISGQDEVRQFA